MQNQLKDMKQYSFSIELTPKDLAEQSVGDAMFFLAKPLTKKKEKIKLEQYEEIKLPIEIFSDGESSLRAIVTYLKEQKTLNFAQIAKILGRDQRTIWTTYNYNLAKKKITQKQKKENKQEHKKEKSQIENKTSFSSLKNSNFQNSPILIDASIFRERKLSVLETLSCELLKNFPVKKVSELLGKNEQTIWTVKRRAEAKLHEKIERQNIDEK